MLARMFESGTHHQYLHKDYALLSFIIAAFMFFFLQTGSVLLMILVHFLLTAVQSILNLFSIF